VYDVPPDLVVTADGPVRLVELNRPEQLNSASAELHTALATVWDVIAADPDARAVVLTGRGRAFSAGGNFDVMTRVQRDPDFREQNVEEARQIIVGMLRFPLPVVAAVNGPAVGLGCSLALLCDLALIADDAYLSDPHVQVGLAPGDGGALLLPLLVGLSRAKELLFLGSRVDATEAVRLGLATRAVPADRLLTEAMELAARLAHLPAQALRATKRAVNLHLEQAMASVMEEALAAERVSMSSPDHIAIVDKIISRRAGQNGRNSSSAHHG
jgi:enoyl-CoA hydratase